MPSVLDRSALEQSPLADLHLLANELGVDGFRRLRKPDLVDAILARQSGEERRFRRRGRRARAPRPSPRRVAAPTLRRRRAPSRGRRGRRAGAAGAARRTRAAPRVRSRRAGRGGAALATRRRPTTSASSRARRAALQRLGLPAPLAAGADRRRRLHLRRAGQALRARLRRPRRGPDARGAPLRALPVADPRRHHQRPPGRGGRRGHALRGAAGRLAVRAHRAGSGDPTVNAIEWLTPFGKGSRVVIAGPSRSGKSEALRRLATALAARRGLEVSAVLAGVRPEEIADFPVAPGRGADVLGVGRRAGAGRRAGGRERPPRRRPRRRRRRADRRLEYLPAGAARRALAAGRNLAGGGSLTVIATAPAPIGGETTVVALDRGAAGAGTFPALASPVRHAAPGLLVRPRGRRGAGAGAGGQPEPVAQVVPPAAEPMPAGRSRKRGAEPAASPGRASRRQDAAGLRRGEEAAAKAKAKPAPAARSRPRRRSRGGGQEAGRGEEAGGGGQEAGGEEARRQEGGREEARGGGEEARRQAQAGRQEARRAAE